MHSKRRDYVGVIFFLLAVMLTYCRLYLGVDFTDESFYVALPYRFVLGDRPFIDDHSIAQSAGLLLIPFIRFYHFLFPSNAALILFVRHLYFLFYLGITLLAARVLKEKCSEGISLFCASFLLLFIPYGIPSLSYNTLGAGLFFTGALWACARIGRSGPWMFGTGVLQALAIVAYPPLIPASVVFTVCLFVAMPNLRKRAALIYPSGFVFTFLVLFFSVEAQVKDYFEVLHSVLKSAPSTGHSFGEDKIQFLIECFLGSLPPVLPLLGVGALSLLARYFKKTQKIFGKELPVFLFILILFSSTRASQGGGGQSHYITYSVLLGFLFLPFLKKDAFFKKLFICLFLPCLIAGLCMSFASNNAISASSTALILPFVLLQAFLFLSFESESEILPKRAAVFFLLPLFLNFVILARFQRGTIFQDDPPATLAHRVKHGPFKGLKTTPEKARYLEEMQTALKKSQGVSGKIRFMPHFPAGYLMTSLRPGVKNIFGTCDPVTDSQCTESKEPALTVKINRLFYTRDRTDSYAKDSKEAFELSLP